MGVCEETTHACGETKEATVYAETTFSYDQAKNRVNTLIIGATEIVLNSRQRTYHYDDKKSWTHSNHRWVVVPDGFGAVYMECYDVSSTEEANISDSYETTDVQILYVDLRNDIAVYCETVKSMTYADSRDFTIPLQTSFDDANLFPFIFENIPISITERLIYAKGGVKEVLHEQTINSGYYDDVNLLMPLFGPGSNPRPVQFTLPELPPYRLEEKTYWANEVDWYYPPDNRESDGDMFLYYPPWLKAVGVYGDLEQREATAKYAQSVGAVSNPYVTSSDNNLHTSQVFTGSVAVGLNGDIFLSVATPLVSSLPDGEKVYINTLYGPTQTLPEIFDPAGTTYFPVAPIQMGD